MMKRDITRRAFLKAAAVTGAAAALAASSTGGALATETTDFTYREEGNTKVIRTACRGCGKFECGVFVTVVDGKAIKIEGDTSYPGSMGNCCSKSQASIQAAYHPDRLYYPKKRTNPKGEDPGWERISWDEAIELSCAKFDEIQAKYGGAALAFFGGTSRIYAMSGMSAMAYLYDSPNAISPGQVCKGPRTGLTRETSVAEFNFVENIFRPNAYVQPGSGIEVSNYDDAGRVSIDNASHADVYINWDARMSNMAKDADYFLHVKPGSDGFIAMAWTKMAIDEELYDDWYVKRWTDLSFLVCEDMASSGYTETYQSIGLVGVVNSSRTVNTNLLKESDLDLATLPWTPGIADDGTAGDPRRYIAYDAANERLTYLDSRTGLWEGEAPFKPKYVPGSEDYIKAARYDSKTGKDTGQSLWDAYEWEPVEGEDCFSSRPGISPDFLPYPDSMPTVSGNVLPTDPCLFSDGGIAVTLKDGSTVKCRTAMEHYYDNTVDLQTAEKETGVPAQLISDSFHAWADPAVQQPFDGVYRGGLNYSVTHEHTGNAVKQIHTMEALDAIMGNIDMPGGHRGITLAPSINVDQSSRILGQFLRVGDKNSVTDAEQRKHAIRGITKETETALGQIDASTAYHAMKTDEPYPLYGGLTQAGGILNQSNLGEAWEGMSQLEFFVDANLWQDPISSLADIMFPEQHWLEIPGCTRIAQGSNGYMGAHIHCIEPPADTMYGIDWVGAWYKQKGTPFWTTRAEGEDQWEMGDFLRDKAVQSTGLSWAEYAEKFEKDGWMDVRDLNRNGFGCCRRFQTGWLAKPFAARPGFMTATTRHEIWGVSLESKTRATLDRRTMQPFGTNFVLPYAVHNKCSGYDMTYFDMQKNNDLNWNKDKYAEYDKEHYPFVLSTGRRIPVYFHSEHRQLPWCREVWPVPRLEVHPADAARLGLAQGDWAWIETPWAKIRQVVHIAATVREGQMNAEHSWWFPEFTHRPGKGFDLVGCNCLVDPYSQCEAYGAPNLRGYMVNVYKATPENSPYGNPCPCDDDGTPCIESANDPRLKEWAPTYEGRE